MPVVLLHPIGLDHRCWQFLTDPRLTAATRYELLGHGERVSAPQPLTLEALAQDIVENLAGDLDLVGISFGAAVALIVAVRWPQRVRSLVLACSGTGGRRDMLQGRADDVERRGIPAILDSTLRRWFTESALSDPDHPGVAYARERLLANTAVDFAAAWRALAELDAADDLARVGAPTTVIHAAQDSGSRADRRAMVERLPQSRYVEIAGPHMVQLENPGGFADAVVDHLAWTNALD